MIDDAILLYDYSSHCFTDKEENVILEQYFHLALHGKSLWNVRRAQNASNWHLLRAEYILTNALRRQSSI